MPGGEVVGSAKWDLDLDSSKFKDGVKDSRVIIGGLTDAMDQAEQGSKQFALGLAAVGTAAIGAIGFGVKFAADLETMTQGFVTLLGSTQKADAAIEMIKKDAMKTPFQMQGLIQANQLITSVTKDAGESERLLLNIGKALTAMGKGQPELDRIIVNLQQIGAVGHASMIDIKQFAFAGIPIFDMLNEKLKETKTVVVNNSKAIGDNTVKLTDLKNKLAIAQQQQKEFTDKTKESTKMLKSSQIDSYTSQIAALTGKVSNLTVENGKATQSQSQLEDMISGGKITFKMLEDMFNQAGEGSGRFAKAFELQGGTFNQVLSNFKDNIGITMGELVKQLGIFDLVKKGLSDLTNAIGQLATPQGIQQIISFLTFLKDNMPIIAGIIIGGLVPAFYAWATAFLAAFAPLVPFIAIGALLGLAIQQLILHFGGWNNIMIAMQPTLNYLVFLFQTYIWPLLEQIWQSITTKLIPALMNLWNTVGPILIPVLQNLGGTIFGLVFAAIIGFIALINQVIIELTHWVRYVDFSIQSIRDFFSDMPGFISAALAGLADIITKPFKDAWAWVEPILNKMKEGLDKINPFHRESPSLVDNVMRGVDLIKREYASLGDLQLPSANLVMGNMPNLAGATAGNTTNHTNNIYIDHVNSKQDIDMLNRELGFKAGLVR